MWKTQLNKAIKELRFVVKPGPEHHGVMHFVMTKLPEIRVLNQNTFFAITEITSEFETDSACHVLFGDHYSTGLQIKTAGLSCQKFEKILEETVKKGMTLRRGVVHNNDERSIPIDIVEARKYVEYMDDGF